MKRLCADDVTDSMPLFRSGRGGAIPTSALQLKISRCKVHRACDLNALWHSRFPKIDWSNVVRNKDYACYVAEYDDIAYAVAIWSSPIAANRLTEGKTALELRRMAICDNAPPNTASRMIGIMRRIIAKEMPHLTILVSYQDTDVHAGTIYKASGWKAVAQNKGTSWTNENRKRNEEQSLADKVRWEYRLKPMNDYWNDPPEYPEVPECCEQEMDVDDQGNCRCAICGKTIERQPDPEPPEMPEFNWENNALIRLPNDVARCDGVGFDENGSWYWREGCETCLRRTAPRGDMTLISFIHPPAIIAFECEFLIEPDNNHPNLTP